MDTGRLGTRQGIGIAIGHPLRGERHITETNSAKGTSHIATTGCTATRGIVAKQATRHFFMDINHKYFFIVNGMFL
jgi:hypothetical protein